MNKEKLVNFLQRKINQAKDNAESSTGGYDTGVIDGNLEAYVEVLDWVDALEDTEAEKVVVPQFVADWIEDSKGRIHTLFGALFHSTGKTEKWLHHENFKGGFKEIRVDLFARAWLDGYEVEVEEEPKWVVKYPDDRGFFYFKKNPRNTFIPSITVKSFAYKFNNKQKAEAVAVLIDGEVEEADE